MPLAFARTCVRADCNERREQRVRNARGRLPVQSNAAQGPWTGGWTGSNQEAAISYGFLPVSKDHALKDLSASVPRDGSRCLRLFCNVCEANAHTAEEVDILLFLVRPDLHRYANYIF